MIGIYREELKKIPCLHVVEGSKYEESLPTIIYFHGFSSAKEQNLPIAYMLAEKGFRVLLPESLYHGERDSGLSDTQKQVAFWNIVIQNVQELAQLREVLLDKGWLLNDQLGVAGTSMGGITTTAALTKYEWVSAAAVMMGTPKITEYAKALIGNFKKHQELPITEEQLNQIFAQLEQLDLSIHSDQLNQRPVMFWHGDKDPVVPFVHSYDFYQEVEQSYNNKENIQFIREVGRDHKVSIYGMQEATKWFAKHLL